MRTRIDGSIVVISHQERILSIADEIVLLSDGHVEKVVPQGESLGAVLGEQASCRKL